LTSSGEHLRRFEGRRIVVAVTGGIAAYKTCYLVRELVKGGADVQVLMSRAGTEFVSPLTFATLSGRPVIFEMFPSVAPTDPVHLRPASWGEVMVIAPATADFIGKLAHGLADDIPSTVAMAFEGRLLVAPAMNPKMWRSPAVVSNMATIEARGVNIIGPDEGEMGGVHEESGVGRMSEPDVIADRIEELLVADQNLSGKRVIVSSGPTREAIDPVRYVSNRSSGAMGDALARTARLKGAEVFLIRGKGASDVPPSGVKLIEVDSAADMALSVKELFPKSDLLVMAAAVADWTVANPAASKLKKDRGAPAIEWTATEDILAWAGEQKTHQTVVGFALETDHHLQNARQKLEQKKIDLIILNDPTQADSAFGGSTTRLTILAKDGEVIELPLLPKRIAAGHVLNVAARFIERQSG